MGSTDNLLAAGAFTKGFSGVFVPILQEKIRSERQFSQTRQLLKEKQDASKLTLTPDLATPLGLTPGVPLSPELIDTAKSVTGPARTAAAQEDLLEKKKKLGLVTLPAEMARRLGLPEGKPLSPTLIKAAGDVADLKSREGIEETRIKDKKAIQAEKKKEAKFLDSNRAKSMVRKLQRVEDEARAILSHPGLEAATGVLRQSLVGEAADAAARFETLKSQVGFNVLQEMRNESPTGGALGQVSEKEIDFLQSNVSTLERKIPTPRVKDSLRRIIKRMVEAKKNTFSAFKDHYGGDLEIADRKSFGQTVEFGPGSPDAGIADKILQEFKIPTGQ